LIGGQWVFRSKKVIKAKQGRPPYKQKLKTILPGGLEGKDRGNGEVERAGCGRKKVAW